MSEELMSVGARLRAARESRGWSVEQVVQQLKLARRQVEAIEADDFDALPGNTFTRGFIRNYARLLELDVQTVLDQLEPQLPQEREQVAFPQASDTGLRIEMRDRSAGRSGWLVMVMVVLGLVIGGGLVLWYLQQPAMPEIALEDQALIASQPEKVVLEEASAASDAMASDVASMVASEVVASAVASIPASSVASAAVAVAPAYAASKPAGIAASAASKPARVMSSAAAARGVRVAASHDTWVQIADGAGRRVFSGILGSGEEQAWIASAPYQVKIGNAPGTRLYYRGKPVDLAPYTRGDVATVELK